MIDPNLELAWNVQVCPTYIYPTSLYQNKEQFRLAVTKYGLDMFRQNIVLLHDGVGQEFCKKILARAIKYIFGLMFSVKFWANSMS